MVQTVGNDVFGLIDLMLARGPYTYFQRARLGAREVQVQPLDAGGLTLNLVGTALEHGLLSPADCHWNAYKMAVVWEAASLKYVEGLIRVGSAVLAHSWLALDDLHFDPTLQVAFDPKHRIRPGTQGLADQYVALEELSATELHRRLGVSDNLCSCGYNFTAPFLPYLWSIHDRRFPSLYTFGLEPTQIAEIIGTALDKLYPGSERPGTLVA